MKILKYQLATMLVLSLGSPLRAADVPNDAYFPMTPGFSWVYNTVKKQNKEHFELGEKFEMKVKISESWEEKGQFGMILAQKDKRGTMREFLTKSDQGIFIYKLGLAKGYTPEVFTKFTPAVPRVIYPLVPGTQVHWEGHLKVAWIDKPIIFDGEVLGFEDIEVPAGKFKCIKLHYHEKRGEEVIDEWAWYAEGVGQIKYDGGQYVKELKSFKVTP